MGYNVKNSKNHQKGSKMAKREKKNRWIDLLYYIAMAGLLLWFAYSKGWILTNFASVTPKEAISLIQNDENITLLDVRTVEEFKAGHLRGATLLPLDQLEKNLDKLSREKKVLVYCQSGNRSVCASRILEKHGYTPVNIKSGIAGLAKEKAEIVK